MSERTRRILRTRLLPWALWLTTMGAALHLWREGSRRSPILGFARAAEHAIGATRTAVVQQLAVGLGQHVSAGQVLARLDARELDAQLRVTEAERKQVAAAASGEQLRRLATTARIAREGDRATTALARSQTELRAKRIELQTVEAKRRELETLFSRGLATRHDVLDLELRQAALERAVESGGALLGLWQRQRLATSGRSAALPGQALAEARATIEAELAVFDRRLERLALARASLTLRAPCAGRVSAIHLREGAVARAGAPVVSVIADNSRRITACVFEDLAPAVHVGARARLTARGGPVRELEGEVVTLGPVIHELPARCRPQPHQPAWGRELEVLLDRPTALVAGEGFNLRLEDPPLRLEPRAAAAGGDQGPRPRALQVPAALRANSRFEPSGLVWVPRLNRYLVVSDDTGYPQRDDHAPWLFTMDARGAVDPQPLVVAGLEGLNDAEAIAAGPDGALYLLCSQSASQRGKRSATRQAFVRIVPQGRGYRADGQVALAALLDQAAPATRAALGLVDTTALNLEGMTPDAQGLLIGLKSPLTTEGRAIIWRLRDPARLVASGRLEPAGLSLWGTVALEVEADGRRVAAGIAELLALPDGALLIAGTASGLRPRRQSGALWRLPRAPAASAAGPAHAHSAARVQTFAGLKPEGLALSPHPGHLVVAFDNDQRPPAWMELPWPRRE